MSTIFGKPAYDYVTLTTFSQDAFKAILGPLVGERQMPANAGKQYLGYSYDGEVVFGEGIQNDRPHYIIKCHGAKSADVIWLAYRHGKQHYSCTRIDAQLSLPQIPNNDLRDLKDHLELAPWPTAGRQPVPGLEESKKRKQGMGKTVYIGSRKSDRMGRIYEKLAPDGIVYLRLEIELKKKRAQEAFFSALTYRPEHILIEYMARMPQDVVEQRFPLHKEYLESSAVGYVQVQESEVVHPFAKTYQWVKHNVLPSLLRRCETEEEFDKCLRLLIRASSYFKSARDTKRNARLHRSQYPDTYVEQTVDINVAIEELVAVLDDEGDMNDKVEGDRKELGQGDWFKELCGDNDEMSYVSKWWEMA